MVVRRTKSISLNDPYVQPIIRYLEHMKREHPEYKYLFPATKLTGFGDQRTLYVDPDRHLTGRQLWNMVTEERPETWPHLFRETQGAKVAKRYGNAITGVFAVKQRLDLERIETAMRYVARYAIDLIEAEVYCEIS